MLLLSSSFPLFPHRSFPLLKSPSSPHPLCRGLAASVPIQCLAIMSLAMGLCSSLMEFAWTSHIKLLYPSPGDFTAFMGDISTWQVGEEV